MSATRPPARLFHRALLMRALLDSVVKLTPRHQLRNPVMFTVFVCSIFTTVLFFQALFGAGEASPAFIGGVSAWLWFTVLFANLAEAVAEGRGKAQAQALRSTRSKVRAKKLSAPEHTAPWTEAASHDLRKGDFALVEAGDMIPADGEVVVGVAMVNESAVTGESAPVVRESGGDRSAVTGGTVVLSDWLVIKISSNPGENFLDRMIALVEGAKRQKTPNEIALAILLAALTIVFLIVCATLLPYSMYAAAEGGGGTAVPLTTLVALFVCLAPTTIGGLLSAIGIAGMDRLLQANVISFSGRSVEAAGDVDVLLLDKTGTITMGDRQAVAFLPAPGVAERDLAEAAGFASLADETPEGRSILALARKGVRREAGAVAAVAVAPGGDPAPVGAAALAGTTWDVRDAHFVGFSALTRMSGVDVGDRLVRKGAAASIERFVQDHGGTYPAEVRRHVETIARQGGTPLVVADGARTLGVVELKDVLKSGVKERFGELRHMGIRTVMITGDNPLTAAAIAAEAGVDDFLAEATPEAKLGLIRSHQTGGRMVAMTGDGTNDAPALAQADVAVAMHTGTQAAKEAGNMVDLDSNPSKLIEIVSIGKQLLMTRGALTTFSLANDVAKYFAILPAAFAATYPELRMLDVMHLASPASAVMSAVIFNALIIVALIPLALRGVKYRAESAAKLLREHLLIYGVGGLLAPFVGIKAIDIFLSVLGLV